MPFKKYTDKVRFVQTATVTVADTTNATTLVGAGEGSLLLLKNSTLAGKTFRVKGAGVFSNTGTPTLNIIVSLGGVAAFSTGAITTVTSATNRQFHFEGLITVRTVGASGTAIAQGEFTETLATGVSLNYPMVNTTTFTVDTTANLAFDVTATWGAASASNTISMTNLLLEELN